MPEFSTPTDTSQTPAEAGGAGGQTANGSSPFNLDALKAGAPSTEASASVEGDEQASRRKVYELTLFADRKSRRAPSSIILIAIIVVAAVLAYIVYAPHPRRHVVTVGKMVYAAAATVGGSSKIYVANVDGTDAKALAPSAAVDDSPAFSPDGNQVAFISTRQGADRQVFMMDADGQNIQQITRNSGSKSSPSFALSTGSRVIGFASSGILYASDATAGEIDQLFPAPPKDNSHGVAQGQADTASDDAKLSVRLFSFAPKAADKDHQATAVVVDDGAEEGFGVLPSFGSDIKQLHGSQNGQDAPVPPGSNVTMGWTPDGGLIAVAMSGIMMPKPTDKSPAPEISGLFLTDGSGQVQRALVGMATSNEDKVSLATLLGHLGVPPQQTALIQGLPHHLLGPAHPFFSPEGDQIYFELWDQTDLATRECKGLYKVAISGGVSPQLVIAGDVEGARFTRDGKSLLYLTKRADGGHDLWSVGIDGAGQKRISDGKQDVTDFALSPQVAHD